MARKYNWALTPSGVADIGAIDDFYYLYVAIQEIYINQKEQFIETYDNRRCLWPDTWNQLCIKQVRKACEPIMNRYLPIFATGYDRIFANAYGFAQFSFLNWKTYSKADQMGRIEVRFISFAEFLVELQFSVTRIIHSWKTKTQPKYAFDRLQNEINDHIASYIREHGQIRVLLETERKAATEAVLYIYEQLSGTSCSRNKHPVIATTFISDFALTAGKLALPVHFCEKCNKYFIGRITLDQFEKNYGKLLVEKRKMSDEEDTFTGFKEESRLFQLGYNVSDGRPDAERQQLLLALLQKKKISYLEMVQCIELNIRTHSHTPQAIAKWKRDLKFIGEYVIGSESE